MSKGNLILSCLAEALLPLESRCQHASFANPENPREIQDILLDGCLADCTGCPPDSARCFG